MSYVRDAVDIGKLFDWLAARQYVPIIAGTRVRYMIGIQSTLLGFLYIYLGFFWHGELRTIYQYQSEILPIPLYAIMFLIIGILTLWSNTSERRLYKTGRNISIVGMAFFFLYSMTFVYTASFTALSVYPVIAYAYFCESFTES